MMAASHAWRPERAPLASVDEVREELRRLGYLDRGLDRFVLAGAVSLSLVVSQMEPVQARVPFELHIR